MSDDKFIADAGRGWRLWLVLGLLFAVALGIMLRMLSLYVEEQTFLQTQGDARSLRTIQVPAHRGIITDRNGEPLAVSAPVATIWADPAMTDMQDDGLSKLAVLLKTNKKKLVSKLSKNRSKRFIYLQRQVTPEVAQVGTGTACDLGGGQRIPANRRPLVDLQGRPGQGRCSDPPRAEPDPLLRGPVRPVHPRRRSLAAGVDECPGHVLARRCCSQPVGPARRPRLHRTRRDLPEDHRR